MKSTPKGLTTKKTPPPVVSAAATFPVDDARSLSLFEALAAFHAHAVDAQRRYNARERTRFEDEPALIDRLIALLVEGNYLDTAARIVGITGRAVREWVQKADQGDPRYEVIARVIRTAEAVAEAHAVANVRAAGKDPRFWAAEMTYLERRHPDRWGKREEETASQQMIVHVHGVDRSEVVIGISGPSPSPGQLPAVVDGTAFLPAKR